MPSQYQSAFFRVGYTYERAAGATDLRGISFFVIGSYPTQATFAFSQLAQLGSFWSHLFFRRRHLLQALTLRKLLLWPTLVDPAPPPPPPTPPPPPPPPPPTPSCLVLPAMLALGGPSTTSCCSLAVGDGLAVAELREEGESLSGEDCRSRLAGCICGEGGECAVIPYGRAVNWTAEPFLVLSLVAAVRRCGPVWFR